MNNNTMKKINYKKMMYSKKWVCPNCGCEKRYGDEGNMKCPNCGAWMQDE